MTCSNFVSKYPSEFSEAYWLINYIDIYDVPMTQSYQYVGCYGDAPSRTFDTYLVNVGSVQECFNEAIANGFQYFGLQYGGECRVSNSLPSIKKYGVCGQCAAYGCANPTCSCSTVKCANGDNCGDGWANAVYQVVDSSATNKYPSMSPNQIPSASIPETNLPNVVVTSVIPSSLPISKPTIVPVRLSSSKPTKTPAKLPSAKPTKAPFNKASKPVKPTKAPK